MTDMRTEATNAVTGVDVSGWHAVGAAEAMTEGEATVVPLRPPIAVFRLDDGFFATDDTCTHAESSLAEGYVENGTVECEFHFAKFCIRSGAALTPPASVPLRTYPVVVRDGTVYVDLSDRT